MVNKLKKLYIGNLPWSVDNTKLAELFQKYPSVTSANVIMDRQTNRSRGFGFVEFSDDAEAMKAVEEMNETDIEGRKLVVNEARPLQDNR
ncbi:MAG: RNA-binding protein [bacterium]|nr:RNA-binding protein [bacterium]